MPPVTRKKNAASIESSTKHDSPRKQKTKEILRELVAEYDKLLVEYTTNPTSENRRRKDEYKCHLKSANKLSSLFRDHIGIERNDTLTNDTKIREVIAEEIKNLNLVKVDGLIRLPKTIPYENISATGNTITIMLNSRFIDELITILKTTLIDDSVQITVPCNNMIIIIELGDYTPNINKELLIKIKQIIMEFSLTHRLLSKETCETTKYYLN